MGFWRRLTNVGRDDRLADDTAREMAFHLEERAAELEAQGYAPAAARDEARRRFGNPTALRERTRDADLFGWLASLRDDVRYAVRGLRANRGFALVAILSLALGIGANTAIFSLVNAVMLRALPVQDPQSLFAVRDDDPARGTRSFRAAIVTNPLWEALRARAGDLGQLAAYGETSFDLSASGIVRPVPASWVSGDFFGVLGVAPMAGRLIGPADDVRGCAPVAVVSHAFARSEYGGGAAAVGRSVSLDGHPFSIIGVTEPRFTGVDVGAAPALYVPICAEPVVAGESSALDRRSSWWLAIIGRLPPGRTIEATRARLLALSPEVFRVTVPPFHAEAQQRYLARRLTADLAAGGDSAMRRAYAGALRVLLGIVGLVLLIACANLANLLLARATARRREMAVRLALGASRGRLVRQLLAESLLLAGLGASLGVVFARWAGGGLVAFLASRNEPLWLDLTPDLAVLGFTAGVAVLTALLFGLAPAWRATRVDPQAAMKAQGRGASAARMPLARALVVTQIALSLVLVVSAALLVGTFRRLATMDPGFDRRGVLMARIDLGNSGLDSAAQRTARDQLLERLRLVPGVERAGASQLSPIGGSSWNEQIAAGDTITAGELDASPWFNAVSPGWLHALGTELKLGRDFTGDDRARTAPVAIVNEALARVYFRGQSPIGRRFRIRDNQGVLGAGIEIVGVMEDAKYQRLTEENQPTVYLPASQATWWGSAVHIALRPAGGDPLALTAPVTSAVLALYPRATLDFVTLEQQLADSIRRPRLLATVSGFFGGLSLLLAVIGLYGTMAYGVAQRRGEIGIRLALGAVRGRVLGMILGEAGVLVLAGAALGIGGALLATKLVASFLYGVQPRDAATLAGGALVLAGAALAAAAIPAWRAASLDPSETLRTE